MKDKRRVFVDIVDRLTPREQRLTMPASPDGCAPARLAGPTGSTAAFTSSTRSRPAAARRQTVIVAERELEHRPPGGTDAVRSCGSTGCSMSGPAPRRCAGRSSSCPRERAPALEPDEWWAEDLEGCAVRRRRRPIGPVRRLLALPSCEVLEVERATAGEPLLVPLVARCRARRRHRASRDRDRSRVPGRGPG